MPKRKRSTKRHGRSRKRRRRTRGNRGRASAPGMLGKKYAKKFRYCDQVQIDAGIGTPAVHTFRLNSLYDPDAAIGGHQPIGFDQLVGVFYNHYHVVGAKITVTFVSSSTSGTTGTAICGIEISNNVTPTTALNDIFEQGKTVYKTLTTQYAGGKVTITRKVSIKKMAGVTDLLDNQDYRGSVSLDPAEVVYAHVFVAGIDASADASEVRCMVQLDQFAILTEQIPLGGS